MLGKVRRFSQEDDGAVTVDWVVLSAVIVGFAIATVFAVRNGTVERADAIGSIVSAQAVYLPE
ncbi:MAG: hypothetical protein AAGK37_14635 [Pseudomonadota bacterium]